MDPNNNIDNQDNDISNEDYINFVMEEQKKEMPNTEVEKPKKRTSIKGPIIVTIIALLICGPNIISVLSSGQTSGLAALGILIETLFLVFVFWIVRIIWVIYLARLTHQKRENDEKGWYVPLIIIVALFVLPATILSISNGISGFKKNSEYFTKVEPSIMSYDKMSEIPIIDGYEILGEDLDEYEVYNNIEKYEGKKVLVKGFPDTEVSDLTYGKKQVLAIYNFDDEDPLDYRFTFNDKNNVFAKNRRSYFTTESKSPQDYYIYVYGTIKSRQYHEGYTECKIINIEPEKIYYTLYWDLLFDKEDPIVYSECAKVGNICSGEDIKKGQVVNVSVNNKKDLDFYVMKDDGKKLLLYAYEAIGQSEYITKDDNLKLIEKYNEQRNSNDYERNNRPHNYWGPYSLLMKENELTKDWDNIDPISSYTYTSSYNEIFRGLEIKDGKTTITSASGNTITLPQTTRARILNSAEIENDYNLHRLIGKPCLRIEGMREQARCEIWFLDGAKLHYANSLETVYSNKSNYGSLSQANIYTSKYIVPVIEIDKSKINNK